MQNLTKSLKNKLLDIFFPKICLVCEESGEMLCKKCGEKIKTKKRQDSNLKNISWVHAALNYQDENLQKIFYALKYNYVKVLAKDLAILVKDDFLVFLKNTLSETNSEFKDLVFVPIPISRKRFVERNYNQSEILLREILKLLEKETGLVLEDKLVLDFLIKIKHTIRFAKTHSKDEREKLIKNAFSIRTNSLDSFQNKKVFILFDDITTTGTTFYEARKILIENRIPKEFIYGYALAH